MSGQLSASPDVEIYTALIQDNGINFARQALPLADYDKNIVPVGLDFEKGGEVTFSATIVPIKPFKFYLEDRITGIVTNIIQIPTKLPFLQKPTAQDGFMCLLHTGVEIVLLRL